jgi:uncharacterized membrane protein
MSENKDQEKTVAILSYFLIGIIWYFVDEKIKKSSFVKYHVKQAINMFVIGIALSLAFSFVSMMLFFIMIPIFYTLSRLFGLALTVLWVFGIVYAAQGKEKPVPLIGEFADKYLKF